MTKKWVKRIIQSKEYSDKYKNFVMTIFFDVI